MTGVHPATLAYSASADTYARGRPDYPAALDVWLRDELRLGPGARVLDLGAGTGKFTTRLVAARARVVAVEPSDGMRAKLAAALPEVEVFAGTAQAVPLADASVDAVVCAQAFHWFATRAALREIHRVLKPGGRLGLVWNSRDARVPWVAKLDAIVNRHEGDVPRYHTGAWRGAFPFDGFSPLSESRLPHGHTGVPEDVIVNRVRSTSFIAGLPEATREGVVDELRALIASEPALAGRDEVTVPYVTEAFVAVRN